MKHGTYIGDNNELFGEGALLQELGDSFKVQFDNTQLAHIHCHGWTTYPASDFKVDERPKNAKTGHDEDCNCIQCLPDPHSRFQ